jgi:hypothetical protein
MASTPSDEDPAQRQLFDTIASTYALASEPEQRAMITELRSRHLRSIPEQERERLIDDIRTAVGRDLEDEQDF